MSKVDINLKLNGKQIHICTSPSKRLIDMLREDLRISSVKEGCGEGECGACTVILNGKAVTSCSVLAPQVEGKEVITIEGLTENGELDVLQQSFIEAGAVQCGFCTPGMILSAKALLMNNPNPSTDEIKRAMSGNLCRCTGYKKMVDAVEIAISK